MSTFGEMIAGTASPTLRRSVIDPVTGKPYSLAAPTGEVVERGSVLPIGRDDAGRLVPAVPGMLKSAAEAAALPGQVARGEFSIFDPRTGHVSDEAIGKGMDLAGLAMTGSLPMRAPKGALRSFGGSAERDDPLAALSAALGDLTPNSNFDRPASYVDLNAKKWDLYHGTSAPADFDRFRVDLPHVRGETKSAPGEAGALFMSPAAEEAAHYAGDLGGVKGYQGPAGPRVIRATVDPGTTDLINIPQLLINDPDFVARARKAFLADNGDTFVNRDLFDHHVTRTQESVRNQMGVNESARRNGYPEQPVEVPYAYGMASAGVQLAKERGLDTAVLRGLSESNGGDQVIALTPGRVRSYYSPDQLLFSGGPMGALPAAATASNGSPQGSESDLTSLSRAYMTRK